jgi:hypothetical protein
LLIVVACSLVLIFFSIFSEDPAVSLNYAIFSYNMEDKKQASRQFAAYEKKMEVFRKTKGSDIEREVKKMQRFP